MHRQARPRPSAASRTAGSTGARVHDVSGLRAGDVIELRHWDTVCHRGAVDVVCPRLGVLWIVHGPLRDRTLVHASEYAIWRMPRHGTSR